MNLFRMLCCALGSTAFAAALSLAGCGGDVTSSGGEGGSGSASSATASTGTTNPTAGGPETCADLCHRLETNNCQTPQADCTTFCQDQFDEAGECADELSTVYSCWLPLAGDCPDEPPAECKAEEDAFKACDAIHGCGDAECFLGEGPGGVESCGCKQTCAMKELATDCLGDPMAMKSTCDCLVDGVSIGMCDGPAEPSCGITGGCCEALFKK